MTNLELLTKTAQLLKVFIKADEHRMDKSKLGWLGLLGLLGLLGVALNDPKWYGFYGLYAFYAFFALKKRE